MNIQEVLDKEEAAHPERVAFLKRHHWRDATMPDFPGKFAPTYSDPMNPSTCTSLHPAFEVQVARIEAEARALFRDAFAATLDSGPVTARCNALTSARSAYKLYLAEFGPGSDAAE